MKKQVPLWILSLLLCFGFTSHAVVTLSTGHVDGFEIHYDPAATGPEESLGLHIHDESTSTHYEPAEVILQVNEAAYGLQGEVFASASRLGWESEFGWVLPAMQSETLDENGDPAMLFVGVAADGGGAVWAGNQFKISLISVGASNPGDFAMYRFSGSGSFLNPINTKNGVNSSDVLTISSIGGHEHWNWAFSEAGEYTIDVQASGTLGGQTYLSSIETFTFHVIPEPSSSTLLLFGLAGWVAIRKRFLSKE